MLGILGRRNVLLDSKIKNLFVEGEKNYEKEGF